MTAIHIPDVAFSDNASQRTPCVLVLDGSASMSGEPIRELNRGLGDLEAELKNDPVAMSRVRLLIIRVGGHDEVEVISDWCDAIDFKAPAVVANGSTPLGRGMALALEKIQHQKTLFDSNGIPSTRPWIFLISDGQPTDPGWQALASSCRDAEAAKKVAVFPIGTSDADMSALAQFSTKPPRQLVGLQFRELFVWLSRSLQAASSAAPGVNIQLPATTGWEDNG